LLYCLLLLLSVLLRRQHRSTLFPYTTLFRSNEETQKIADNLLAFLANEVEVGNLPESLAPLQSGVGSVANAVLNGMQKSQFKDLDRKSTRLNSSHVKISYAVFCLKKKKY